MSEVSRAFVAGLGRPRPRARSGLKFAGFGQGVWDQLYADIGAGFYQDRFYYLFGEGVDRLSACLDAWSFIVPPRARRMLRGRRRPDGPSSAGQAGAGPVRSGAEAHDMNLGARL